MAAIPLPGSGSGVAPSEGPTPFTLENFGGLDTKSKRPAIKPEDFYWLENWIPIGAGNLRTIYDHEATPIYTATNPRTIIFYTFFNIGSSRYAAIFLDNGTAVQVNTDTLAVTTISATANKFYNGGTLPHAAQYQSKYLAITSKVSDNAYWIWDGTSLFGAGTLAPQVTITRSGEGSGYASAPTITAYGGAGSGATFTPTLDSQGHVTDIKVTNPGTGYNHEDLVTLVITGGGVTENQARATATVTTSSGGVAIVTVTNGGTGYTNPTVTFAGGGGSGAKAFVSGAANGVITEITVTDPGTGYTSAPTVTIAGGGASATAIAEIRRGQVTAITVNNGGSGYTGMPDVIISAPNNADFPNLQAEAYATISAGAVTAITITKAGLGYKSASVQVEGGNNGATAEITLMPYGIKGTSIETYQDRVWVFDDTKLSYTGPDNVSDFSGAGGGGSKPITDSFLREKVVRGVQANGFLYRMADSSINVISNVQTNAQTGSTSFNDANVDPQIGVSWRDSVAAFGRALVFANPTGVYALYGGAAEKVSSPLDGLFATASFNTGQAGLTPTACVATIFGLRCYCLSFTTTDPYTNTLRDIMACWDGQKWFICTQTLDWEQLAGQEINSELTGYASTTTAIYRMFQVPSADLTKIGMSKLASNPSYMITDQVLRVAYIAQAEDGNPGTMDISVENESGPATAMTRDVTGGILNFVGTGPIQFTGLASADLNFSTRGLVIDAYDDSQYGQLIGVTFTTEMPDLTLISMALFLRPYAPNV